MPHFLWHRKHPVLEPRGKTFPKILGFGAPLELNYRTDRAAWEAARPKQFFACPTLEQSKNAVLHSLAAVSSAHTNPASSNSARQGSGCGYITVAPERPAENEYDFPRGTYIQSPAVSS